MTFSYGIMAKIYFTREYKKISQTIRYTPSFFLEYQAPAFIQKYFPSYSHGDMKAKYDAVIQDDFPDSGYTGATRFAILTYNDAKVDAQTQALLDEFGKFFEFQKKTLAQARTRLDTNTSFTKVNSNTYIVRPAETLP